MFVRIGTVIWWIGAAIMALALGGAVVGYYQHMDCPQIMATHAKNEAASYQADATYRREHPDKKGILADFDAAAAMADAAPESQEMQRSVESCSRYSLPFGTLAVVGIITLILWALAFVCGGSFWKPPVART